MVNDRADQSDSGYQTKMIWSVRREADFKWNPDPFVRYAGPCIIKVRAVSDANNAQVSGGFGGYIADQ